MSQQLQHKLLNYHAQPPVEVWDKINLVLNKETAFPERLANYHLTPPIFIWDNIAASLEEDQTPVLSFTKRYAKPIRYGGVAASLLFVALLTNLLLSKKSVSGEGDITSGINQNILAPQASEKKVASSKNFNEDAENKSANSFAYTNREGDIPVKVMPLRGGNRKSNARFTSVQSRSEPIVKSEILDRYTIFSKTSGEAFRVSKKLFTLFLCSEKNEYCKLNIAMVQGRIASPSILASADFSGVLDILQSMDTQ